ncbi:DUF4292 domain-containing protein [Bacteroidota bacterium]
MILLILISSCTSKRSIIKKPIKAEGPEYLFNKLAENELKFNTISAKFKADYLYEKKKTEFKGQIRIKKDSIIWISFSPALGIEVARLVITNDSVKFLNRLEKTYFIGDYEFVNNFLETNIDFDILQSFIIGNDFQFYEKTKFGASIDAGEYRLNTLGRNKLKKYVKEQENNPKVYIQTIWLNADNFKISRLNIKEIKKENKKLHAYYSDFKEINNQLFPFNIRYELTAEQNIDLILDYTKLELNKELNFPFKIPRKYERIY